MALGGRGAVVFGAAFDSFGVQRDTGEFSQQVGGLGEWGGRGGARSHLAQSRRQRGTGDTELVVTRNDAAPAGHTVVVGAPQVDRTQHGLDRPAPIGDEFG
jgi:hypothetical protein